VAEEVAPAYAGPSSYKAAISVAYRSMTMLRRTFSVGVS